MGHAPSDLRIRVRVRFEGRLEREGGYVFAVCDHAPLATHGADEDEALERMDGAIAIYLRELAEHELMDEAIRSGKLRFMVEAPTEGADTEPHDVFRRDLEAVADQLGIDRDELITALEARSEDE